MKTRFVTIAQLTFAWALLIPSLACDPPPISVDIKAEVYTSRTGVKVKNADNFDWNSAEIGVALTSTGPFYSKKIGLFAKGDTRTVAMNDMDNSGERLIPMQ